MKRSFVLCCALLLGCSDGSGPGGALGGRYSLVLVDDQPLPKLVNTFGISGTQHLVAQGDLFFDGAATIQRMGYDQKSGSSQVEAFRDSTRSSFQLSGSTLLVAHVYGLAEVQDTGYVDGPLLIIRQNLKTNLGQKTATKYTLKYQRQ